MPPKALKAAKVVKIPACIVGDLLKVTLWLGDTQTETVMAKVSSVSGDMVVTVHFENDFSNKVHVLPTVLTKKVVVVKLKKGSKEKAPLPPPSIIGFEEVLGHAVGVRPIIPIFCGTTTRVVRGPYQQQQHY